MYRETAGDWGFSLLGNKIVQFLASAINFVLPVNITGNLSVTGKLLVDGAADVVQATVKGHSTQTAKLQEWTNDADSVVADVSVAGAITGLSAVVSAAVQGATVTATGLSLGATVTSTGLLTAGSAITAGATGGDKGAGTSNAEIVHQAGETLADIISAAIIAAGLPPAGQVTPFAGESVPGGWLYCNGQTVSRTTYAGLFTAIADMYGVGDGSTTFEVPDYRGEFIRGFDDGKGTDPDAASRTDRGDGTTGDAIGTKQAFQTDAHVHTIAHTHTMAHTHLQQSNTIFFGGSQTGPTGSSQGSRGGTTQGSSAGSTGGSSAGNSGSVGGSETRPGNVSAMFIIKT
jgi:microcystin-dependent protein